MAHCLNMNFSLIKKITPNNVQNRRVLVFYIVNITKCWFCGILAEYMCLASHTLLKVLVVLFNLVQNWSVLCRARFLYLISNWIWIHGRLFCKHTLQGNIYITPNETSVYDLNMKHSPLHWWFCLIAKIKARMLLLIFHVRTTRRPMSAISAHVIWTWNRVSALCTAFKHS